jgi:hypothetical protein
MACGFSLSADRVLELIAPLIVEEEEKYAQWLADLIRLSGEKREPRVIQGIAPQALQELKEIQSVANCAKELGIDKITLDADALRLIGLLNC